MHTNQARGFLSLLAVAGLLAVGCAHQPSSHLVDARRAYSEAHSGEANQYAPDDVYEAKVALDQAEQAYERKPGSEKEQHLAYVAQRKAVLAMMSGQARKAEIDLEKADSTKEEVLLTQRDASRGDLEETKEDLEETKGELTAEQAARSEAEKTAAAALASLNELATIKAEEDRVVITLSGEVLFKTNEATLLPIARDRLDKVAEVLLDQGEGKKIIIAGHTDSKGKDAYNTELSRKRAESVRTYLVGKGVPTDAIEAIGKGENEPIADNRTAEGRANNRRVEIIIGETQQAPASAKR